MQHDQEQHQSEIIDQFSRQAIPFAKMPAHMDAMQLLIDMAEVTKEDNLLDVACGPGLVACAFAPHAAHVTGLDITAEMIEQARRRQQKQNLANIEWRIGDAQPLPFAEGAFSRVITRYSFHHFLNPTGALAEMIRVCRVGGRVLVADVATHPEHAEAFDRSEKMRDPSHTHALTTSEFAALFAQSGLGDICQSGYALEVDLDELIANSFPRPDDGPRLRQAIVEDIGLNRIGFQPRLDGKRIFVTFPIAVYAGWKQ
jgi:ubiquinone/menaquinone biosynthesis C-methylase UbiE